MVVLKIGNLDVSAMLISYEVEHNKQVKNVKTNAQGDTTFSLVKPKYKIYCIFSGGDENERKTLLEAIDPYYLTVTFRDPITKSLKTISCYPGIAKTKYTRLSDAMQRVDEVSINFIEM